MHAGRPLPDPPAASSIRRLPAAALNTPPNILPPRSAAPHHIPAPKTPPQYAHCPICSAAVAPADTSAGKASAPPAKRFPPKPRHRQYAVPPPAFFPLAGAHSPAPDKPQHTVPLFSWQKAGKFPHALLRSPPPSCAQAKDIPPHLPGVLKLHLQSAA